MDFIKIYRETRKTISVNWNNLLNRIYRPDIAAVTFYTLWFISIVVVVQMCFLFLFGPDDPLVLNASSIGFKEHHQFTPMHYPVKIFSKSKQKWARGLIVGYDAEFFKVEYDGRTKILPKASKEIRGPGYVEKKIVPEESFEYVDPEKLPKGKHIFMTEEVEVGEVRVVNDGNPIGNEVDDSTETESVEVKRKHKNAKHKKRHTKQKNKSTEKPEQPENLISVEIQADGNTKNDRDSM